MNANKFNTLHQQALAVFAADMVGEYVAEVPGVPWFAVTLGDGALIAEHYEAEDMYALKTHESDYLIQREGEAGADEIWAALQCVGRATGYLDMHAVTGSMHRLTSSEESRLLKKLERRGLLLTEQIA
ncbi:MULTISPECIES: hypothetical protein [Ralstonia solanacearum species complex]|uniref:Phage protein n=2 Tax=Ralstonia solanacearum TaxID=305 RepID=A0ABF7RBQ7_RALSL|nr:hypothetical protein [Ralstonia solanacearum]ALF88460.1 hypothetical protein RSUY_21290 [Ralstonia solanacearum]ATI27911.1 hypothetical protein CCY86_10650 [Ralstonia solanacearum]ATJ86668.1 hypothetical protein CDC59_10575 [Ralstonia solanacearum]EAP74649.1 hypothetical protein RRSL_04507 [Ralstonia solanacearum UW551]KEI32802.1 hypothetical protein CQ06_14155 [Ralstonia solanacearum]